MWHHHKEPLRVGLFGYDWRDRIVQELARVRGHQVIWIAHIHQAGIVLDFLLDDPPDILVVHPLARVNFPLLLSPQAVVVIGPSRAKTR